MHDLLFQFTGSVGCSLLANDLYCTKRSYRPDLCTMIIPESLILSQTVADLCCPNDWLLRNSYCLHIQSSVNYHLYSKMGTMHLNTLHMTKIRSRRKCSQCWKFSGSTTDKIFHVFKSSVLHRWEGEILEGRTEICVENVRIGSSFRTRSGKWSRRRGVRGSLIITFSYPVHI